MIIGTYRHKKSSGTGNQLKGKEKELSDSETEPESEDIEIQNDPIGWAYVGSHNFTPSAWGTLSGSGFNPTLNVSHQDHLIDALSTIASTRLPIMNWELSSLFMMRRTWKGYHALSVRRGSM